MKIVIDDKVPYIHGVFEPFARVEYLPGAEINSAAVSDASALVTRTRTICDSPLLEGSKVRLIATATIGFDHIDTQCCAERGIEWVNAPGCNAESVNQYLASALLNLSRTRGTALKGKTMGIVGVGHVGSRLAKTAELLDMRVLLNDPPRERAEGSAAFVSLEEIMHEADFISFHVPLNREGEDATWHMVDHTFIGGLKQKPVLINTCRGEVFDTDALRQAVMEQDVSGLVIDCWENEPSIDLELLDAVELGTAHIAGYSRDGKAGGTTQAVRAISRFFSLGIDDWTPVGLELPKSPVIQLDGQGLSDQEILAQAVLATYDISEDDRRLREAPQLFEQLRGDYSVRREFDAYTVDAKDVSQRALEKLRQLNFRVSGD